MAADSLKVVVRLRPYLTNKDKLSPGNFSLTSESITCGGQTFQLDRVFGQQSSNEDVWLHVAKEIVLAAMDGYNGTIFTYGQTASGKTYTVNYLRQKAIEFIYEYIENCPSREFLLRMSYLELYNEKFQDLLTDESKLLSLREDLEKNVFLQNLSETYVKSLDQVLQVLSKGDERRHFAETLANDKSSRSHCIFRIIIESRLRDDVNLESSGVFVSNLNIIDLAGSEKASENANKDRLNEGCMINKSLLTLSQVIRKLSEGERFINYRDSKLTRYLQNALGGNSKTGIILTICPTSIEETLSTLKFGQSAKKILNRPCKNEILSENAALKKSLKEIERLKEQIRQMGAVQPNKELEEQKVKQQNMLDELRSLLCVSSKVRTMETKEKNRRQTVCVPQFSRLRAVASSVAVSAVLPSASIASNVYKADTPETCKMDQLNLSFKDYEQEFIQGYAFMKLKARIVELEEDNKRLKELLHSQTDCLQSTKEPSLVCNESLMVDDGQGEEYTEPWEREVSNSNYKLVRHEKEWEIKMNEILAKETTLTSDQSNFVCFNETEQQKLDEQKRELEKQERYIESKIDKLTNLEELKEELEASKNEIQLKKESLLHEKRNFKEEFRRREDELELKMKDLLAKEQNLSVSEESILQEKKNFKEKTEAWEKEVIKSKEELKRREDELELKMKDLLTKEQNLICVSEESILQEKRNFKEKNEAWEREVIKSKEELKRREDELELKMKDLLTKEQNLISVSEESMLQEKKNFKEKTEAWEKEVIKSKEELKRREDELELKMKDLLTKEQNLICVSEESILQEKRNFKEKNEAWEREVIKSKEELKRREDELELKMKDLLTKEQNLISVSEESMLQEKKNFKEKTEAWEKEVIKSKEELKRREDELELKMKDLLTKEQNLICVSEESILQEKRNFKEKNEAWEREVIKSKEELKRREDELELKMKDLLTKEQNLISVSEESMLQEKKNFKEKTEAWEKEVIKSKEQLKRREDELELKMKDLLTKEQNCINVSDKIDEGLQTDELSNDLDAVKQKQHEMVLLELKLGQLEKQQTEKEMYLNYKERELFALKEQLEAEREEIDSRECLIAKEKAHLNTIKLEVDSKNSDLRIKKEMCEADLRVKEEMCQEMDTQLKQMEQKLNQTLDELTECVKEKERLRNTIDYGKKVLANNDINIAKRDEIIENLTMENEEMERKLNSLTEQFSDATAELAKVSSSLMESRANEETLLNDVKKKKGEIKTLQAEAVGLKKTISCLRESLEKDGKYYRKVIEDLKKRSRDLNHDGSFLQPKSLEPSELQIRNRLELEFRCKIKDLETSNSAMAIKISELNEQLSEAEASNKRPLNVLIERTGSENTPACARDQEFEVLKEKYQSLKAKLIQGSENTPACARDQELEVLKEKYQSLKAKLNQNLTMENEEMERKLNSLTEQFSDATAELTKVSSSLMESRANEETLLNDVKKKKGEIKTLQAEAVGLKKTISCLRESLEKDGQYYRKVIEDLKRSRGLSHDGSFLQPKSLEPSELQIRNRLELEFRCKIKDLETSNSAMAKKISELNGQLSEAKTSNGRALNEQYSEAEGSNERPLNVLIERTGSENTPACARDQELEVLKEKYQSLKAKLIQIYNKGYQEVTQECPKCSARSMGGGAVEGYKLYSMQRELEKLDKENNRLKEELKRCKSTE